MREADGWDETTATVTEDCWTVITKAGEQPTTRIKQYGSNCSLKKAQNPGREWTACGLCSFK